MLYWCEPNKLEHDLNSFYYIWDPKIGLIASNTDRSRQQTIGLIQR